MRAIVYDEDNVVQGCYEISCVSLFDGKKVDSEKKGDELCVASTSPFSAASVAETIDATTVPLVSGVETETLAVSTPLTGAKPVVKLGGKSVFALIASAVMSVAVAVFEILVQAGVL